MWLTILLTTAVCIMPVVAFRFLRLSLKPDLSDTVRSLAELAVGVGGLAAMWQEKPLLLGCYRALSGLRDFGGSWHKATESPVLIRHGTLGSCTMAVPDVVSRY